MAVQSIVSWGTGFYTLSEAQEAYTMGTDNLSNECKLTLGDDVNGGIVRKHRPSTVSCTRTVPMNSRYWCTVDSI